MADVNREEFSRRIGGLKKKADPKARVVKRVREDGLVVEEVRHPGQRRGLIPIKGILIVALVFVGFKGVMLAELGEPEYLDRVEKLKQGGTIEVSAAFLLDADPATRAVADMVGKVLR